MKKHLPVIILSLVLVFALGSAGLLYRSLRIARSAKAELETELSENTQTVYVTTKEVKAGETLLAEGDNQNVELQTIYTGIEAYNYITAEDIGKIATVTIDAGIPVMYSMVTQSQIQKDTRDYEMTVATLMTDQQEYDYVDVRISFATGEDYLLLAKKPINSLDLPNSIFHTNLNEEEILRLQSAVIDAYVRKGARIYVTRYVQPSLQEEAAPNYPVNTAAYDLITNKELDPNVMSLAEHTLSIAARLDLENRLGNVSDDDLEAVGSNVEAQEALLKEIEGQRAEEIYEEEEE